MRSIILVLSLFGFLLIGCGGSSSKTTNITPVTLIEKVIDGEVSGATVFLDLDRDNELDNNEPTIKTKDAGATASDDKDGDISSTITTISNLVNINSAGNVATQVLRSIEVTTKPIISGTSIKTSPIGTLFWPLCGQINKDKPSGDGL
jgi:hypothetical protein